MQGSTDPLPCVTLTDPLPCIAGIHSYLIAEFLLQRHMGHFMINVYVPCTMLVILSWVGFWINREATGDRIALGKEGAGRGGGGWGLG